VADLVIRAAASLIWPLLVLFVVLYFGSEIKAIFHRSTKQDIKFPGGELSFDSTKAAATQFLGAAQVSRQMDSQSDNQQDTRPQPHASLNVKHTVDIVNQTLTPTALSEYSGKRILWVDDHPENNEYMHQLFQSLGMTVDTSTSTKDALARLSTGNYDVVITDMRRGDDTNAGYELLDAMKQQQLKIPLIIYSGSSNPIFRMQAEQRGAVGETSDPTELLKLVWKAIVK